MTTSIIPIVDKMDNFEKSVCYLATVGILSYAFYTYVHLGDVLIGGDNGGILGVIEQCSFTGVLYHDACTRTILIAKKYIKPMITR